MSFMNHNHKCVCEHTSVKFCKHCNTVYCLGCNQEWGSKINWTYSPYTITTTPYTGCYPNTGIGGRGNNFTGNLNTLKDGHTIDIQGSAQNNQALTVTSGSCAHGA